MDLLKPQLLWIGKRCYRVNAIANDNYCEQPQPATNEYIEDGLCVFLRHILIEMCKKNLNSHLNFRFVR